MEQAGQRNWWPWALAGVVVMTIGCGFMSLVFGGAAGWLALSSRDRGAETASQAATATTPARPTARVNVAEAPSSASAGEAPASAGAGEASSSAAVEAPAQPPPAAEAPAQPPPAEPQGGLVTHVHPGGWAVDLGTHWRVEFAEESPESNMYNYSADVLGSGNFEPGMTRVRIEARGPSGALPDFVATLPSEIQQFDTTYPMISEELWSLPDGLQAMRRDFDVIQELVFVVHGLGFVATGMGDPAPFDEAMRTLRPVAATFSPAALSEGPPCSQRDSAPALVIIENSGVFGVTIQWIDYDCNPVEVISLAPGESLTQQTGVGDVFTAGGHGYDHGTYVVPDGGGTWTITGPVDFPGADAP